MYTCGFSEIQRGLNWSETITLKGQVSKVYSTIQLNTCVVNLG